MIQHGTRPTRIDHRDYDFLKSHGFAGIGANAPELPEYLLTDAGLWMPDQNAVNPVFNLPALPYGCTDYTQADLAGDIDGVLRDPSKLEAVTHANRDGGCDIRISLQAARSLGWIRAFYNIRPGGRIDAFDAIRLATLSAQPEKRSVSWGTPWFPSWENAAVNRQSVIPMPTDTELQTIAKDSNAYPWHNSKHAVWKTINGVPHLINKSWQGTHVGENGWLYFPREVVNVVMSISGSVAYTATKAIPQTIFTVDVTIVQQIVSYIRNLYAIFS